MLLKTFRPRSLTGLGRAQILSEHLLHRINTADGPYPMTGVIGDGILLQCAEGGGLALDYHFNVPIAAFHDKYERTPRLVFSFGYGDGQRRKLEESLKGGTLCKPEPACRHCAHSFQPSGVSCLADEVMLWFYTGAVDAVGYREKSLARLLEALHVNWDTWNTKAAVLQFLKHKVAIVSHGTCKHGLLGNEEIGDLHVMPPRPRPKVEWGPGEVIVWVHNHRPGPISLQCQLQKSANALEEKGEKPKLQWEDCGSIEPGEGLRFRVNDGDRFEASEGEEPDATAVQSWMVDVSRGVVQDTFVDGAAAPAAARAPPIGQGQPEHAAQEAVVEEGQASSKKAKRKKAKRGKKKKGR